MSEISLNDLTLNSSIGPIEDIKPLPAPMKASVISLTRPSGPIVDKGAV